MNIKKNTGGVKEFGEAEVKPNKKLNKEVKEIYEKAEEKKKDKLRDVVLNSILEKPKEEVEALEDYEEPIKQTSSKNIMVTSNTGGLKGFVEGEVDTNSEIRREVRESYEKLRKEKEPIPKTSIPKTEREANNEMILGGLILIIAGIILGFYKFYWWAVGSMLVGSFVAYWFNKKNKKID